MKVIKLLFLYLSLILILKTNSVKSDDLSCLINLANKLFGLSATISTLCTGNSFEYFPTFSYASSCFSNGELFQLRLISSVKVSTLIMYSDLSCFNSNLNDLILKNVTFDANSFGTEDQKAVAGRLFLETCTFDSERLSSASNSLPKNTTQVTITIDDHSNLHYIDFKAIKYLSTFQLLVDESKENVTNYPFFKNDLTSSDVTNFYSFEVTLYEVPGFNYFKAEKVNIKLLQAGNGYPTLSNLSTLSNVKEFTLSFDNDEISYPTAINVATNGIKELTFNGKFSAPQAELTLQPGLERISFSDSPNFNINGKVPFNSYPSTLVSIVFGNFSLKTFPTNLPNGIQYLSIFKNNFSINGPVVLPDLSSYKNLKYINFYGDGFSGTIPESYCQFSPYLVNNSLSGTWPQCFSCHYQDFGEENFDFNPLLSMGSCLPGSVVPNLEYNENTNILKLYGKNLGLNGPSILNIGLPFDVIIPQSSFSATWNQTLYGNIPDTVSMYLGDKIFTLATKALLPEIYNITKSGNQYTIRGTNFSYNNTDFSFVISNIEGTITYSDFNTIQCSFTQTLPSGQDISSILTNSKTSKSVKLTVNTVDDKTTEIKQCSISCGESLGQGKCSNSTGQCICTQYYTGISCDTTSQFLSSISSTLTTGGVVNMWGWFGATNNNLNITIGNQPCLLVYVNSTFANCTIGAGTGTQSVIIVQNNFTWIGSNIFHYTELTYKCPKDCSGNGQCNKLTGQCTCFSGWGGYDCNSITNNNPTTTTSGTQTPTPTNAPVVEIPKSNTTINETVGSAIISNQQTSFEISILSLIELDIFNNIVSINNLTNQWQVSESNSNNVYTFSQTIQESCSVVYTIEEIKETRDYQFAGLNLTLDKDSIKISVSIQNYTFSNALNQLQLRLQSTVGENNIKQTSNNECNDKSIETDTNQIDKDQLLNYVTISKNQKTLYGRFINRVLSDSRETFITTEVISNTTSIVNDKESFIIGLNLPHCTTECLIDPDFSVLVSNQFKKCSSGTNENSRAWVLPVAIVVPCVAVVAIIIIGAIVVRKNRSKLLIAKHKFSLKSLSRKEKGDLYMPNN